MPTTAEIMEGCFRGDPDYIEYFYKKFHRLIYYAIHKWMKDNGIEYQEHVMEIFQGAFLVLMEDNFDSLRSVNDINSPGPLIYTIASRYTAKYFRRTRERMQKTVVLTERQEGLTNRQEKEIASVLDEMKFSEISRIILEGVSALDEQERVILTLRFWNNLSYDEIATEMDLTPTNVGVVLLRAKKSLVNFIREQYPDL